MAYTYKKKPWVLEANYSPNPWRTTKPSYDPDNIKCRARHDDDEVSSPRTFLQPGRGRGNRPPGMGMQRQRQNMRKGSENPDSMSSSDKTRQSDGEKRGVSISVKMVEQETQIESPPMGSVDSTEEIKPISMLNTVCEKGRCGVYEKTECKKTVLFKFPRSCSQEKTEDEKILVDYLESVADVRLSGSTRWRRSTSLLKQESSVNQNVASPIDKVSSSASSLNKTLSVKQSTVQSVVMEDTLCTKKSNPDLKPGEEDVETCMCREGYSLSAFRPDTSIIGYRTRDAYLDGYGSERLGHIFEKEAALGLRDILVGLEPSGSNLKEGLNPDSRTSTTNIAKGLKYRAIRYSKRLSDSDLRLLWEQALEKKSTLRLSEKLSNTGSFKDKSGNRSANNVDDKISRSPGIRKSVSFSDKPEIFQIDRRGKRLRRSSSAVVTKSSRKSKKPPIATYSTSPHLSDMVENKDTEQNKPRAVFIPPGILKRRNHVQSKQKVNKASKKSYNLLPPKPAGDYGDSECDNIGKVVIKSTARTYHETDCCVPFLSMNSSNPSGGTTNTSETLDNYNTINSKDKILVARARSICSRPNENCRIIKCSSFTVNDESPENGDASRWERYHNEHTTWNTPHQTKVMASANTSETLDDYSTINSKDKILVASARSIYSKPAENCRIIKCNRYTIGDESPENVDASRWDRYNKEDTTWNKSPPAKVVASAKPGAQPKTSAQPNNKRAATPSKSPKVQEDESKPAALNSDGVPPTPAQLAAASSAKFKVDEAIRKNPDMTVPEMNRIYASDYFSKNPCLAYLPWQWNKCKKKGKGSKRHRKKDTPKKNSGGKGGKEKKIKAARVCPPHPKCMCSVHVGTKPMQHDKFTQTEICSHSQYTWTENYMSDKNVGTSDYIFTIDVFTNVIEEDIDGPPPPPTPVSSKHSSISSKHSSVSSKHSTVLSIMSRPSSHSFVRSTHSIGVATSQILPQTASIGIATSFSSIGKAASSIGKPAGSDPPSSQMHELRDTSRHPNTLSLNHGRMSGSSGSSYQTRSLSQGGDLVGMPMSNMVGMPMSNAVGMPMSNAVGMPMSNGFGMPMSNVLDVTGGLGANYTSMPPTFSCLDCCSFRRWRRTPKYTNVVRAPEPCCCCMYANTCVGGKCPL